MQQETITMSYHSNLSLLETYRVSAADEARRMNPALAGAPAGAVIIETTPASPSLPSASQEGAAPLATPRQPTPAAPTAAPANLLDELTQLRDRARRADSPIARRELIEQAEALLPLLFDPILTCSCGAVLDASGDCPACLAWREHMDQWRARMGDLATQRDEDIPF
jgi:hypothetical protein